MNMKQKYSSLNIKNILLVSGYICNFTLIIIACIEFFKNVGISFQFKNYVMWEEK